MWVADLNNLSHYLLPFRLHINKRKLKSVGVDNQTQELKICEYSKWHPNCCTKHLPQIPPLNTS